MTAALLLVCSVAPPADGAVVPRADGGRLIVRVYDLRGRMPALTGRPGAAGRGRVVQRVAGGGPAVRFEPAAVVAVKAAVSALAGVPGAAPWDGPAAAATIADLLVVRQTAAGHAALATLLDAPREPSP